MMTPKTLLALTATALLAGCGGASDSIKPGITPPPAITSLDAAPAEGVELGASMTVRYSVSSQPLRTLRFVRSGAVESIDSVDAGGKSSLTDSVTLAIPTTAIVGRSISLRLEAEDDAHEVSSRDLALPVPVYARQPPELASMALDWIGTFNRRIDSLTYFAGDTIVLKLWARDNVRVRWVGYRLTGALTGADSMATSGATPDTVVLRVAIGAVASGGATITTFARDGSGQETVGTGRVRIIPVVQHPTAVLPLQMALGSFRYDAKRDMVIATHFDAVAALELISISPFAHAGTIALPGLVSDADLTAGGDTLLVAISQRGMIAIVDLVARRVIDSIPINVPGLSRPPINSLAVAASGRVLVSVFGSPAPNVFHSVIELDLATGAQRIRTDADGSNVLRPAASSDRSEIVLLGTGSCSQLYVDAPNLIGGCTSGLTSGGITTSDARGTLFLSGPYLFDNTLAPRRTLLVPNFDSALSQLSPDGTTAYFATGIHGTAPGFAVVKTSDGSITERQMLPIAPRALLLLPDGVRIVAHGPVCYRFTATSSGCDAPHDIYLTTMR